MMARRSVYSLLAGLALLVVLALALNLIAAGSSEAALGNQGVPARCVGSISWGQSESLSCVSSGDVPFDDDQMVPPGYYFLVTDVIITPEDYDTGTARVNSVGLSVRTIDTQVAELSFHTSDALSYHVPFNTPYLVVSGGQWLQGVVPGVSNSEAVNVWVFVSGVLTTNVTYLPTVQQ